MKNFDLDQIKDRRFQEMPEDFYDKMQQTVLDNTIFKDETSEVRRSSKLNWYYAAAASLVILFGGTFIFTNQEQVVNSPQMANENISTLRNKGYDAEPTSEVLRLTPTVEENESIPEILNEVIVHNTSKKVSENNSISKKTNQITKTLNPEDQIDFLLENFSAEEMEILAKNSDKDVYLDLYN